MKKPYLSPTGIRRALLFLEGRRQHAARVENARWVEEYTNAIRVIESLSAIDLPEKRESEALARAEKGVGDYRGVGATD